MVRTICSSTVAGRRRRSAGVEGLPGDLVPAHAEVLGDVADRRAFDARATVVPADVGARWMVTRVVAVARFGREIDSADEGDSVVDDDRLLVMAVHRPFLRVERALDLRVLDQLVAHLANVGSGRPKERQRRSRPGQQANVETLGQFRKQRSQHERVAFAVERERGSEVPAREMNVRLGLVQRCGDRRQGLGAVDENLERVPGPRREVSAGPTARRRIERLGPPDSPEPALMVPADLLRDLLAEPALRREEHPPERLECRAGFQILR